MEKWHEMALDMLRSMVEMDASDLHIGSGDCPYFRVHGTIVAGDFPPLSIEECENIIFSLISRERKRDFIQAKTLDFSFSEKKMGRFRINVYQQKGTVAAAVRRLPEHIPTLEELGLPVESVRAFCRRPNGLILVSGPVGSGKTTTMASMIDYINRTRNCHIISIEDPIEYLHENIKSVVHQREVPSDTPNFVDALKYILREDPDVVVIGEMRDLETISSAVTIAETGHLVLATLHTADTSESIRRIVDVFPASQQLQIVAQLSCTLAGVINQMLVPTADGNGRVLASEVMIATPAVQNLIREGKVEQIYSHIQMGSGIGMQTMNQSLCALAQNGKITKEMALAKTKGPKELAKLLEREYA